MSSILNNLSDRVILLLTYQKVEGMALEFKEYKKEQAMQYYELDKRISNKTYPLKKEPEKWKR